MICEDDVEAMRLVIAASKNGWTLPEEMAVMGFNNFAFGRYVDPPLTTIQFPYDYLAKRLLVRALELSSGQTEWSAAELPAPEVVLRESCGGRAATAGGQTAEPRDGTVESEDFSRRVTRFRLSGRKDEG